MKESIRKNGNIFSMFYTCEPPVVKPLSRVSSERFQVKYHQCQTREVENIAQSAKILMKL